MQGFFINAQVTRRRYNCCHSMGIYKEALIYRALVATFCLLALFSAGAVYAQSASSTPDGISPVDKQAQLEKQLNDINCTE